MNGCITVPFFTSWADRHGVHTALINKDGVDLMCLYCPDTNKCYYIDPKRHGRRCAALRLVPTRNNQKKHILYAEMFTTIPD